MQLLHCIDIGVIYTHIIKYNHGCCVYFSFKKYQKNIKYLKAATHKITTC